MNKPPNSVRLQLQHISLSALEWGRPGQPPLLALHGWMDNAASFVPLAGCLDGVRLIAPDMAGHGRSAHRPASVPYDFAGYLSDVVATMDSLALEQVALVGHSMGAGLASLLAATFPERVSKLVLIEGLGPLSGRAENGPKRLRKYIRQVRRGVPETNRINGDFAEMVRNRAERGGMSEDAAAHLVERGVEAVDSGFRWRNDLRAAQSSPFYLEETQVLAFLERITSPALLIKAESGLLRQKSTTYRREQAISGLAVAELGGGHHLHMDSPEVVSRSIREFLQ